MAEPLTLQLLDLPTLATPGGQVLATTAVTNGLAPHSIGSRGG